jgi:hypothetical protein
MSCNAGRVVIASLLRFGIGPRGDLSAGFRFDARRRDALPFLPFTHR